MTYKAYLKQWSEGCDYTIGCGKTIIEIEAKTIEEAVAKLRQEILENYNGERELEICELYEINRVVVIGLETFYQQLNNKNYGKEN